MKRLSALVLALGCSACAHQPSNDLASSDASSARSAQAGAPIGLARVNFQPGVAIIESSVEHVLYPGNEIKRPAQSKTTKPRRAVEQSIKPASSEQAAPERIVPIASQRSVLPQLDLRASPASEEELRRAWLRHCKDSPEMTSRDWEIVTTTIMPSDIAEYWDKHCAEGS
jgi:hypothetical protein